MGYLICAVGLPISIQDELKYVAKKKIRMKKLFLFSVLLCLGYCAHIDLDAYPFSSVLRADGDGSPLYTLYWNFNTAEETITFAVKARTNGWVGFGVSPNGGMVNSDVVIGWVNDGGQAFLHVSSIEIAPVACREENLAAW